MNWLNLRRINTMKGMYIIGKVIELGLHSQIDLQGSLLRVTANIQEINKFICQIPNYVWWQQRWQKVCKTCNFKQLNLLMFPWWHEELWVSLQALEVKSLLQHRPLLPSLSISQLSLRFIHHLICLYCVVQWSSVSQFHFIADV